MRRLHPGMGISAGSIQVCGPEAAERIIALQAADGEGYRGPLLRAAGASELALAHVFGGARVPAGFLKLRLPSVVLLDDDRFATTSPDAWPQARRLARWARTVVLLAGRRHSEHYELFVRAAVRHQRLLVVELEYRHFAAWRALVLLERKSGEILCFVPRPGGQHPAPPSQSGGAVH